MKKEQKAVELLKRLREHISPTGPYAMNAVYISPIQQLRNQADEMEQRDALIREVD